MTNNGDTSPAAVTSYLLSGGKMFQLPSVSLGPQKAARLIATARLNRDRQVQLTPGPGLTMPKSE